ncbi:MAG: aminotransferase class V-fold PLP-dependent enzyme [Bryobacterales bacterium]|nr:aminotransferase class V-fold PLP-dependent enzyme [Bryobacterales bacterium]
MEIWRQYADEFPVTKNLTYLNHAAVAPLSAAAAKAMADLAADARDWGSLDYDKWLSAYEGLRVETAKLIGASPREIAIVKNTSEGIATVALGIDWRAGDIVVAFREEFPANYYPWLKLEARGVKVRWLSIYDPLEAIDAAAEGARLLAISHVNYLSGYRVDLTSIGEICRRRGCFYFVDAIQGMGAFPIDVERDHIDALSADGHKWLLGPEGCGVLYVRHSVQDQIEPVEFGWTNVAAYADYASRDMTLRSDAGRYEPGTLNTIGIFGLRASIALINQIGVAAISAEVTQRARQLHDGAKRKGYEILPTASGIVTFRKEGVDSRIIVKRLRDAGIIAAPRQGYVRTSPHFYVSPDSIEACLEQLP